MERKHDGMTRAIRAIRLNGHNQPIAVERVPLREPGPEEVVVDLAYAGVNPVDGYAARGRVAAQAPLPRTLGGEAAGWLDGKPVLVTGGGAGTAVDGVWAEAITIGRRFVLPLPGSVDLAQAACLGIAGITAWNTVIDLARVSSADRVLELGAGGGVGMSILSMAASRGARVLGQVGSEGKAAAVRAFGADLVGGAVTVDVVVADAANLAEQAAAFAPTAVFDPLGGAFTRAALSVLAPRGRLVLFGTSSGTEAELALQPLYRNGHKILGYGGLSLTEAERTAAASAAAAALAEGNLRIHVGRTVALSQAADLFDLLADRSLAGKLVIDCTA
jgi:NADPH2:quinone reductase